MKTPPPWKIGGRYNDLRDEIVSAVTNNAVATVWTREWVPDPESSHNRGLVLETRPEGAANAKLIAAAPDLLTALIEMTELAKLPHHKHLVKAEGATERSRRIQAAELAILKAGGKPR